MDTYLCGKCGFVSFREAPDTCPVCGAKKEAFKLDSQAIKKPADPANLTEGDKKHIPQIKVVKQCGLAGPGCTDVHIKIGEILHAAEEKHFIMYIDVYLDAKFIARYHMQPDKLNPILGIHLKADSGKLLALENCNIHGRWIEETNL